MFFKTNETIDHLKAENDALQMEIDALKRDRLVLALHIHTECKNSLLSEDYMVTEAGEIVAAVLRLK